MTCNGVADAPFLVGIHTGLRQTIQPFLPARSFVFGDGDANEDFDGKRWQAVRFTVRSGYTDKMKHVNSPLPSCLRMVC